jgi:hypothetical protein
MTVRQRLLATLVVAFLAALAGVLAGRALVRPAPASETALHAVLYHALDLDAGQRARLDALNTAFATRKAALEAEMKADNARLAQAIQQDGGYGPHVAAAVDRTHHVMGTLQKETLEHVFAMRAQLKPHQLPRYDAAVARALTAPAP